MRALSFGVGKRPQEPRAFIITIFGTKEQSTSFSPASLPSIQSVLLLVEPNKKTAARASEKWALGPQLLYHSQQSANPGRKKAGRCKQQGKEAGREKNFSRQMMNVSKYAQRQKRAILLDATASLLIANKRLKVQGSAVL